MGSIGGDATIETADIEIQNDRLNKISMAITISK
jgi:cation transport ATPase